MKEIFRFFHKCFFALQKFKSFFILSIFFDALLQGIKLIEPWILASMLDSLYKNSKDVFLQKVATLSLIIINGCFSKKSYSFLCDNKRYIDNMTITLDGPAEIHNARRPLVVGNSFSTIVNNLSLLSEKGFHLTVQINIDDENISSVEKLILELCSEINYPRVTFALNPVLHQTSTISDA